MTNPNEDVVIFIIDTNSYSGNFERQMAAYIIAHSEDCGVGSEESDIAEKELTEEEFDWFEENMRCIDSEHGYRFCTIWSTPNRYNDGMGKHYDEPVKKGHKAFPAYESVAIFLQEYPPENILKLMKNRATKYCLDNKIELKRIRVIERKVKIVDIETVIV